MSVTVGLSPRARIVNYRPAAWYQFGKGLTIASGACSQWADTTSNVRHLIQATGSQQPLLQTDGSLLFDGSNDFMQTATFTLGQPTMLYMLFRQVTFTNGDLCCDGFTSTSGNILQDTTSPNLSISAGTTAATNTGLAVNTYGIASILFNGTTSSFTINKKTPVTGNAGTTAMAGFTLGSDSAGANNANIQVKEIILFAGAHDLTKQFSVVNYLSTIGGLGL